MRPLFAFISLPIIPEQTNKKPNLHPPSCRKHEIRPCRAMQSRHNFAPWQFFHTFAPDFPKTHFVHERQSKRIYLRSHRRSHLRDEPIVCPSALQRRDDSRLCLIFPLFVCHTHLGNHAQSPRTQFPNAPERSRSADYIRIHGGLLVLVAIT